MDISQEILSDNPYNQSMDTLHNIIEYLLQGVPATTLNQFPMHIYQSIGLAIWSSAVLCLCQHLRTAEDQNPRPILWYICLGNWFNVEIGTP